jgi:protein disulfide-isomerase A6
MLRCGHCQKLEPEWKAAAKKLKNKARLGAVDATVHKQLAQKYQIQGFPTIKEFGVNKKKPKDYQGGRSRKDIVAWVKNSKEAKKLAGRSTAFVTPVDFNSFATFLQSEESIPSVIYFPSTKGKSKKVICSDKSRILDCVFL